MIGTSTANLRKWLWRYGASDDGLRTHDVSCDFYCSVLSSGFDFGEEMIDRCFYCSGEGFDPHDTDPHGRSMYTPCPKCDGTGLTREALEQKLNAKRYKAVDDAWERNR